MGKLSLPQLKLPKLNLGNQVGNLIGNVTKPITGAAKDLLGGAGDLLKGGVKDLAVGVLDSKGGQKLALGAGSAAAAKFGGKDGGEAFAAAVEAENGGGGGASAGRRSAPPSTGAGVDKKAGFFFQLFSPYKFKQGFYVTDEKGQRVYDYGKWAAWAGGAFLLVFGIRKMMKPKRSGKPRAKKQSRGGYKK